MLGLLGGALLWLFRRSASAASSSAGLWSEPAVSVASVVALVIVMVWVVVTVIVIVVVVVSAMVVVIVVVVAMVGRSLVISSVRSAIVAVLTSVVVVVESVVASSIYRISVRTCPVVVAAVGIASVDRVVPSSSSPSQRTVEVVQPHVAVPLVSAEHVPEVGVAAAPPASVEVALVVHAEQVVEVDLVCQFILFVVEVELVCHLVGEEQGFALCHVDRKCCGGDGYRHHQCQCHYLFHCCRFFGIREVFFSVSHCKDRHDSAQAQLILPICRWDFS